MISFIIPTYNEEKNIASTLEQLKKGCTLLPFEIIVTDDISTDKTVEIARTVADQVVIPKNKTTIAANRNRGAAVAQFPYLIFVDSGVKVPNLNQFIQATLEKFKANPDMVALAPRVHIDSGVATFTDRFFNFILDIWFSLANNFLGIGLATGKLQVIKKEAFIKTGGYDESLVAGEDNDLFNRLSKIGSTCYMNNLTVYHMGRREHALGWIKLISIWIVNGLSVLFFKRAASKEWRAIR